MDDEFGMFAPEPDSRWGSASPRAGEAVATLEEILYAEALRLQIRESYLKRREPPPPGWMTSAD